MDAEPNLSMDLSPVNHSDFSQDIKDLGNSSEDLLDFLPETQPTPPSQLTRPLLSKKRPLSILDSEPRQPLKRLYRSSEIIAREKKEKKKARDEAKAAAALEKDEKKHKEKDKKTKLLQKHRAILGNIWNKAFEFPATMRFMHQTAMVLKTLYPTSEEGYAMGIYKIFFRKSDDSDRESTWEEAQGNDDPSEAVRYFRVALKEEQKRNPDWTVCYDPILSDRVLADIVARAVGHEYIITNTKGDGWQWNDKHKLWEVMEAAHATRMITDVLTDLHTKKKIICSDLKEEKTFLTTIGQYGKCINIVKSLSALRPEQKNLKPNASEWELPVISGADKKTPYVINLKILKFELRGHQHFFTGCTGRYFIISEEKKARVGDKFLLRCYRRLCSQITSTDFKIQERDDLIKKIYPDAYQFISTSIPLLAKRDWFTMRLSLGLTTNVVDRAAYFIFGIGSNGKSKQIKALTKALGKTFADTVPKSVIIKKAGREFSNPSQHTAHLVPLVPLRLGHIDESDRTDVIDNSSLKLVAEGGDMQVRGIFKDFQSVTMRVKVFVSSQFQPIIDVTDQAMWDRLFAMKLDVRYWTQLHELKPEQDGWDEKHEVWWVHRTAESDAFCERAFVPEPEGYQNQIFSYYCLVAHAAHHIFTKTQDGILPVPEIIRKETKEFFSQCDEVKTFLDENTKRVESWQSGDLVLVVYQAFVKWQNLCGTARAWKQRAFLDALKFKGLYNQGWRSLKGTHTSVIVVDEKTRFIEEMVAPTDLLPVAEAPLPPRGAVRELISADVQDVGRVKFASVGEQVVHPTRTGVEVKIYDEGGTVATRTLGYDKPQSTKKKDRFRQMTDTIEHAESLGIIPTGFFLKQLGFGSSMFEKYCYNLSPARRAQLCKSRMPTKKRVIRKKKMPVNPSVAPMFKAGDPMFQMDPSLFVN